MRILITVDPEIPVPPKFYGGIERVVDGLICELQARGHTVGLVAHADSTCAVERLYSWPCISPQTFSSHMRNLLTLLRAAGDFCPDLIHSFSRLGYLLPFLPRNLPKVMSYQRPTGGRQIRIASRLAGSTLKFTGCSEFIAAMGRRGGGEWRAIPNFVDTAYYQFQEAVEIDAPLVFLSRVERIKGAHTAIAVAKRAKRHLIIAGNKVETVEGLSYWKREIEPYLLSGEVEYVGPVNDEQKNELLGRAAAMLVPIEWDEPFGIVFAEALACGTPVISCPRGALPEIVREGKDGFLVRDLNEACAAVDNLPSINRADCRQRAEAEFSSGVVVDKYLDLYRQMKG